MRPLCATGAATAMGVGLLKGWWLVAFGDVGGVECAFGVNAVGAVLLAGAAAGGHHQPAVAGASRCRWGSR
jgi:hypothetical protein